MLFYFALFIFFFIVVLELLKELTSVCFKNLQDVGSASAVGFGDALFSLLAVMLAFAQLLMRIKLKETFYMSDAEPG